MWSRSPRALSVGFNLYWRLRYLFVTNGDFGGQDVAVVDHHAAVRRGGDDRVGHRFGLAVEKTAAARLATTALGVSAALAGALVWVPASAATSTPSTASPRNVDRSRRLRGVPGLGGAAAIVAPTTLYAVFLIKPPTLAAYRSAAQKCLTLIAFWAFAAAACASPIT